MQFAYSISTSYVQNQIFKSYHDEVHSHLLQGQHSHLINLGLQTKQGYMPTIPYEGGKIQREVPRPEFRAHIKVSLPLDYNTSSTQVAKISKWSLR